MSEKRDLPIEMDTITHIRFQDCDPFGHLNNARYVDYFMNARQDQLAEHYGFRLFEHGKPMTEGWVVSRSYLAYLAPAAMAEEVIIRTRLIEFTDNRLVVEGVMLDSSGARLKAVSWIEFTYFSLASGRPAKHSADLMSLFNAVAVPGVFSEDGFNARVGDLRSAFRALRQQPAPAVA
jgi:acyl-CoA thioester hydrolase